MGVSGLADGFLAGFGTMDNYYRGKRADERADKDISLREAAVEYGKERDAVADKRYDDETNYKRERDAVGDEQWNKTHALNEMSTNATIANQRARLVLDQARYKQDSELHKLTMQQHQAKGILEGNQALFASGFDHFTNTGEITPELQALYKQNPDLFKAGGLLGQYNYSNYADGKMLQQSRVAIGKIDRLVNAWGSGEIGALNNAPEPTGNIEADAKAHQAWEAKNKKSIEMLNDPEFIPALGSMFASEIQKGVGEKTADGRVIVGKELDSIVPHPNGLVFNVKVKYDNGQTDVKPITEGRSSDPKDPPKFIDPKYLMEQVSGKANTYAVLTKAAQNNMRQVGQNHGFIEGVDKKGLNTALDKISESRSKALSALSRNESMSPEERAVELDRINKIHDIEEQKARERFGASAPASAGQQGAGQQGGGDAQSQLSRIYKGKQDLQPIIDDALGLGVPAETVLGFLNEGKSGEDALKREIKLKKATLPTSSNIADGYGNAMTNGYYAPNKPEGGTKNNGQNNGLGPKPDVVSKGGYVSPAESLRVMGVNNPNDVKPKRGLIDVINDSTKDVKWPDGYSYGSQYSLSSAR